MLQVIIGACEASRIKAAVKIEDEKRHGMGRRDERRYYLVYQREAAARHGYYGRSGGSKLPASEVVKLIQVCAFDSPGAGPACLSLILAGGRAKAVEDLMSCLSISIDILQSSERVYWLRGK